MFLVIMIQYSERHSVINHCDRHVTLLTKKFLVILIQIQYSERHSMINHCDRHITLLSDTDTVLWYSQRHSVIIQCDRHVNLLSDNDTQGFVIPISCYLGKVKIHAGKAKS